MMNIHIIGAGAIGKLLAAKMALSGGKPVLVTRRASQADKLRAEGLSLTENGQTAVCPVRAVAWPEYAAGGEAVVSGGPVPPADAVFLAVKQQHLDMDMLRAAERRLKPDGIAVAWMNGIGHEAKLADVPGETRSVLAVTTEAALSRGDAAVEHTGSGVTKLGLLRGGQADAETRLKDVGKGLRKAGFDVSLSNDIRTEVWNKLVINAVINPLTAIHGIPNGALADSPFLRQSMRILFQEARSVASREGVTIDDALWDRLLDVCRRTARNRSSMLQDLATGKKSEIDWINGSLIRTADRHGLPVPGHRAVFDAVRGIENARS